MTRNLKDFILPLKVINFLNSLSCRGMELVLVGGAVRDFLIKGEMVRDLDFEFRTSLDSEEVFELINSSVQGKVKQHSFDVFNLSLGEFDLEFARARFESYEQLQDLNQGHGHSDFSVKFLSNLSFRDSFIRRDFSFNAIGILYEEGKGFYKLIDPFNGVKHIESKTLLHCSENFTKDPVRLLRLIRFSINLNFALSTETLKVLSMFNLEKLTYFYFFKEGFKTRIFLYIKRFFQYVDENNIKYPLKLNMLRELFSFIPKIKINNSYDFYWSLIIEGNLEAESIGGIQSILPIKANYIKKLFKLSLIRKGQKKIDFSLIRNLEFTDISKNKMLLNLYELYKLSKSIEINKDLYYDQCIVDEFARIEEAIDKDIMSIFVNKNVSRKQFSLFNFYFQLIS